jgi:hypothetical protein
MNWLTMTVYRKGLEFIVLKLALFSLLMVPLSAAGVHAAENKLALVIGNSGYQRVPALPNPRNDAIGVANSLESIGFDVIKLVDATAVQQKNAVRMFLERLAGFDVGLFFYAGHGISINGYNYLIPVDASITGPDAVERELLRVDKVLGASFERKKILVFLDACRDNPFIYQVSKLDNMRVTRGLAVTRQIKVNASQGLSRLDSGNQNLFVAFATQPGNVASDGLNGEDHSPFSKGLIENLQERLEVRELMTKVRASVARNTDFRQIPWEQNSLLEPVYLAGKPDLGKMTHLHIASVSKVNKDWGYVVADLVGERKPAIGELIQIRTKEHVIEAKVGKVMANRISILPATWEYPIPTGARVTIEEFTQ